jgi:uncharacterized membrane-anchored protein
MRLSALVSALVLTLAVNAHARPAKEKRKAAERGAAQAEAAEGGGGGEAADNKPFVPPLPGVKWIMGPGKGDLGNAVVEVPAGFAFTGRDGTKAFLEATENPVGTTERGTLWRIPPQGSTNSWFVIFEYEDSGHVKDDDKDDIDADALLESLQEGTEASNEERRQRGWSTIKVTGWHVKPQYDEASHNVEWATKAVDEQTNSMSINHNVRILGRTGVTSAVLVAGEEELATATPEFKKTLSGFAYNAGDRYGDYKQGDKLAAYGIAGLVLGGAVAVAAKSGLLGKLIKPIILGIAAIGAGIAKMFKRGGGSSTKTPEPPKQA